MLNATKTYMGPVLFLEEDYYVSPDFYHMLRLLYDSKKRLVTYCNLLHVHVHVLHDSAWRCSGLRVSAPVSESSSLEWSPKWRHTCSIVLLPKYLTFVVPLSTQVLKWVLVNGQFQKISIHQDRQLFRILRARGGFLNWNSEGMG